MVKNYRSSFQRLIISRSLGKGFLRLLAAPPPGAKSAPLVTFWPATWEVFFELYIFRPRRHPLNYRGVF